MTVHRSIADLRGIPGPAALAIGVFDGVHLGHQEVISAAREFSQQHGGSAVVLTFDPHPLAVLRPGKAPRLLCSTAHKLRILASLGIERALVCPFDDAFAQTPARGFIESLVRHCQPLGFVSVGYTWRFGQGGSGDIHLLADLAQEHGFRVYGVPPVKVNGETVSSTAIREAVSCGAFAKAKSLLGREYTVYGTVIAGEKRGRQLGFPTANLDIETEQLPPGGVYAVEALLNGEWQPAVANLGCRPTVAGENGDLSLEAHLLDFDGDLYGRTMEVRFAKHLREEKKFSGLDELKAQIAKDVVAARLALGA